MYYAIRLDKKYAGLVIVSKDDLCIWQRVLEVDNYWRGEVENELTTLRSLWDKGELPEAKPRCEYTYNKKLNEFKYWHCSYCGWKDKCEKLEGENWPVNKLRKE